MTVIVHDVCVVVVVVVVVVVDSIDFSAEYTLEGQWVTVAVAPVHDGPGIIWILSEGKGSEQDIMLVDSATDGESCVVVTGGDDVGVGCTASV